MDLTCISEGSGGFYYKNHLPKLGQKPESLIIPSTSSAASSAGSVDNSVNFDVGERVRVLLDVTTLKDIQEGHGGWNDKMEEVHVHPNIWLFEILTDWMEDWMIDWQTSRLTDCLIDWPKDWLSDDRLSDQKAEKGQLTHW